MQGERYEVCAGPDLPVLRLIMAGCEGTTFTADGGSRRERLYEPRRSAATRRAAGCGARAISRPNCSRIAR